MNLPTLSIFLTLLIVPSGMAQGIDPIVSPSFPLIQNPSDNTGKLANISTRGTAGPGDAALIAGFVVTDQVRYVLIRAVGPTLSSFGITAYLRKPRISLYDAHGVLITSIDSWSTSLSANDRSGVALLAREVGAFPLLASSDDAVLHLRLSLGAYTVVVSSSDGQSGIAVVEVYASPTYVIAGGPGGG